MPDDPPEPKAKTQHWVDAIPSIFPQARQDEETPPARPALPPRLADPLAPPARHVELLSSLSLVREPEGEPPGVSAIIEDYQGKLSYLLVNVCDQTGHGTLARAKRPLSEQERSVILDAFIVGQELARAQVILLSDKASQEERDSAIAYVERIKRSVAKYRGDSRWLFFANGLDSLQPRDVEDLGNPIKRDLVRWRILHPTKIDQSTADAITDDDLRTLVSAWCTPEKGKRKWSTFRAFCERIGVHVPARDDSAKRLYAAFKNEGDDA